MLCKILFYLFLTPCFVSFFNIVRGSHYNVLRCKFTKCLKRLMKIRVHCCFMPSQVPEDAGVYRISLTERQIITYFNGMQSRYTKNQILFHKIICTKHFYILNTNIIHNICSVIKHRYVGVTDKRNALVVDCQGELDHFLPFLDQLEAL